MTENKKKTRASTPTRSLLDVMPCVALFLPQSCHSRATVVGGPQYSIISVLALHQTGVRRHSIHFRPMSIGHYDCGWLINTPMTALQPLCIQEAQSCFVCFLLANRRPPPSGLAHLGNLQPTPMAVTHFTKRPNNRFYRKLLK